MLVRDDMPEYQRIKRRLVAEIRSGHWPVGSAIPSESQLLAKHKVSRATVVRSLQELALEGYLHRRKGKGTYVADFRGRERKRAIPLFIYAGTYRLSGGARQVLLRIMSGIDAVLGPTYGGVNVRQVPGDTLDDNTRRTIDELRPPVALVVEPSFNTPLVEYLQQTGCVTWVVNEPVTTSNSVYLDQERAGYLAAHHLLAKGRRRVALLNGPVDSYWGFAARLLGYQRAHADAGVSLNPRLAREGAHAIDSEAGRAMLRAVLDEGLAPDGVVGASDSKAMGAMALAAERGFRVHEQVAFVSIDNTLADQADPPLSSVALPFEELGRQAALRAKESLEREPTDQIVTTQQICLQPHLVVRGA
jgi:DNA-binding LacI/PurR family transcriptional regulator